VIKDELVLPEGVLLLNRHDPIVSGALSLGIYEAFFAEEFRRRLRPGMTVIDIGANLGYYTLIASPLADRVIAFEPESENVALLAGTITRNDLANVVLIQKGLGDKEETRSLSLHPDNKGKHSLLQIDEEGVTTADINVTTLDAALAPLSVAQVGLIKIDIEGWEAKALRGARATLLRWHPALMFEFSPERIRAAGDDPLFMLTDLLSIGYTLKIIDEDKHRLIASDPEALCYGSAKKGAYVNIIALYNKEEHP
jgi:FkbM family methyltransferase